MKHCVFCEEEFSNDVRFCPNCRDYKGLLPGPVGYDETGLDAKIAAHIAEHGYDHDEY